MGLVFLITAVAYAIVLTVAGLLWKFVPEDKAELVSLEELAPELFYSD